MPYDQVIAERIRELLSGQDHVREVRMFGGLAFMVREKMVAAADSHGRLMLRCDPDRADALLGREGADRPEMRGRRMSKGWLVVAPETLESDQTFGEWIQQALDYNAKVTARGG